MRTLGVWRLGLWASEGGGYAKGMPSEAYASGVRPVKGAVLAARGY